jgi:DNA replication protein DnaC
MSRQANHETLRTRILEHFTTLRIPFSTEDFDEVVARAEKEQLSPLAFLERLLSGPANCRRERSIQRRIHEACFPDGMAWETFDWQFNARKLDRPFFEELATGEFVRRRDNLVFLGQSGLGKSHLVVAVARRLCLLGYRVRYLSSAELLEDLTAASGDKTLPSRVRYYGRFDLLIIDEFGFEKLERREYPDALSLLFKVVQCRNRRSSTALVTNIDPKSWTDYLGDPPLAMALLDRIVDAAIIYQFEGKSYRDHRSKPHRKGKQGTASS